MRKLNRQTTLWKERMLKRFSVPPAKLTGILLFFLAAAFAPTGEAAETGKEILESGNFSVMKENTFPEEWKYWNASDQAETPDAVQIRKIAPGKNALVMERRRKRDRALLLCREQKVDSSWRKIRLSVTARLEGLEKGKENWQTVRFFVDFYSSDGRKLPGYHGITLNRDGICADSVYEFTMNPKAAKMIVYAGFIGGRGKLTVERFSIKVLTTASPRKDNSNTAFEGKSTDQQDSAPEKKYVLQEQMQPECFPVSSLRERMILNGVWKFKPADSDGKKYQYGLIRVPGLWARTHPWLRPPLDGVLVLPSGCGWNLKMLPKVFDAWYEKNITLPASWQGKRILLEMMQVCSDAEVFVNGRKAGTIRWPDGSLDLTSLLVPGKKASLKFLVHARSRVDVVEDFYLYTPSRSKGEIYNRGIGGDVALTAIPAGPALRSMFLRTSVRNKELEIDLELKNPEFRGTAEFEFIVREWNSGKTALVRKFSRNLHKGKQPVTEKFKIKWENPKLWDYKQPNLYTLEAVMTTGGQKDAMKERFGFREFRIEGRNFILNEKIFRGRPCLDNVMSGGMPEALEKIIGDKIRAGFNLIEIAPENFYQSGNLGFRSEYAACADELGIPVIMAMVGFDSFIPWGQVGTPERIAGWEREFVRDWKGLRNHPSVVMLNVGFNRFGNSILLSPRRIGQGAELEKTPSPYYKKLLDSGNAIMSVMKKHDPTRPAISHSAGAVGDVHTQNVYLNFIPLQEREAWLSEYVRKGDRSYLSVEFGCPLSFSLMRGRECGPGGVHMTEPMLTEFCAIYLGDAAYRQEWEVYREDVPRSWISTRRYQSWHSRPSMQNNPVFLDLVDLFIRNSYRSWRAMGVTGGMIPWAKGNGWEAQEGFVELRTDRSGGAGPIVSRMPARHYNIYDPETITKPGRTLVETNSDTLAWIAGNRADFTAKHHHFYSGTDVEKQLAVINDLRRDAEYRFQYEIRIGTENRRIAGGTLNGTAAAGTNVFRPFSFRCPDVAAPVAGDVTISGTIGGIPHRDKFEFTIYPPVRGDKRISVYDPAGKTANHLAGLGFRIDRENGIPAKTGQVLVIGEKAMSDAAFPWPELERFVVSGGKALLLGSAPEIYKTRFGFRVAPHLSRRVFPIPGWKKESFPGNLTPSALRDWNGSSDFVPTTYGLEDTPERWARPYRYGFHWGNVGSVSSSPLEKPHLSGWTPLLECEFALAYSPLLELRLGKGVIRLCTLDFISRSEADPAADTILANLIRNTMTATPVPARKTCYFGGDRDFSTLREMQMDCIRVNAIPDEADVLLVIGRDAEINFSQLKPFLAKGGNILVLPRKAGEQLPGFTVRKGTIGKNTEIPDWDVMRGISLSDLFLKCDFQCDVLEASGPETAIAANGMLGLWQHGKGKAVFLQVLPAMLQAEKYDYRRFSTWRVTRTLSQLFTNLGGSFPRDRNVFRQKNQAAMASRITVDANWRAEFEFKHSNGAQENARIQDPGNKGILQNWHKVEFDDSRWRRIAVGTYFQTQGDYFNNTNGAIWYRTKVVIPKEWKGHAITLNLGIVDDMDITYFNGKEIGVTDERVPNPYAKTRIYPVKQELVRFGEENTIAVRVFDNFGFGGIRGLPLLQAEFDAADRYLLYVDNYNDGNDGDDIYRWTGW